MSETKMKENKNNGIIVKSADEIPSIYEKKQFISLLTEIAKRVSKEQKSDVEQQR